MGDATSGSIGIRICFIRSQEAHTGVFKRFKYSGSKMLVRFPYNRELIDDIKTIPGRKYDPNEKGWHIPESFLPTAADMVRTYYPNIADTITDYFSLTSQLPVIEDIAQSRDEEDFDTKYSIEILEDVRNRIDVPYELYPYQEIAVAFLESRLDTQGALIGDQPGLGKTIEALAWLSLQPKARPVLVVTQASIKRNWYREVEKWLPNATLQILDQGKDILDTKADVVIINYDLIWREKIEKHLTNRGFKVVIFDEVTYLKERTAKRTKSAKKIARKAKFTIGLSGTPILNRPMEFFTFLNIISPKQFPNNFKFGMRYCNGYHNGFGYTFKGASRIDELRKIIKPLMIRRRKDEVLTDLPEKSRRNIFVDMPGDYYQDYMAAEKDLVHSLRTLNSNETVSQEYEDSRMWILSKLNYLRHLVGLAKAEIAEELIQNFVDAGEKLVVFCHHHDVIDSMEKYLQKKQVGYVKVDGRTPNQNRQERVDQFQDNPECMVFLASTAMGMGVTLTAASNALFVERQWTPGIEEQMEDRIHRIGQDRGVVIHYMQIENSIDEKMARLVEYKRGVLNEILDGDKNRYKGDSLMNEVLAEYS